MCATVFHKNTNDNFEKNLNSQCLYEYLYHQQGFLVSQMINRLPAASDSGSIPGLGRSPGEGNGNSLQNSCLGNPMDRGAWWATVYGVAKSQT